MLSKYSFSLPMLALQTIFKVLNVFIFLPQPLLNSLALTCLPAVRLSSEILFAFQPDSVRIAETGGCGHKCVFCVEELLSEVSIFPFKFLKPV